MYYTTDLRLHGSSPSNKPKTGLWIAVVRVGLAPPIGPAAGEAAGDSLELIVDGGIRRGSHIFKALALGASACAIGRPYLYGLAAGGELGVDKAIDILGSETRRCMQLAGCESISTVQSSAMVINTAAV